MAGVPKFEPKHMQLLFDPEHDARSPWVTLVRHKFINGVFRMTIPASFRCDLASVPWAFLWLVGPNGKHQRAALFHDYGYRTKPVSTRSTIDEVFRAIMLYDGVSPWRAWVIWAVVRLCGWTAWRTKQPPAEIMP